MPFHDPAIMTSVPYVSPPAESFDSFSPHSQHVTSTPGLSFQHSQDSFLSYQSPVMNHIPPVMMQNAIVNPVASVAMQNTLGKSSSFIASFVLSPRACFRSTKAVPRLSQRRETFMQAFKTHPYVI